MKPKKETKKISVGLFQVSNLYSVPVPSYSKLLQWYMECLVHGLYNYKDDKAYDLIDSFPAGNRYQQNIVVGLRKHDR